MRGIFHAGFQPAARKPLRAAVRSSLTLALAVQALQICQVRALFPADGALGGLQREMWPPEELELRNFPGDLLLSALPGVVDQRPEMQHMFSSNYS